MSKETIKEKEIYLVTCADSCINYVYKYYNKNLALEEYKEFKRLKYKKVKLSLVIKN